MPKSFSESIPEMLKLYRSTRLRIINNTKFNIVKTYVYATDDFDWFKDSGPHRNFQNVAIDSGMGVEHEERIIMTANHCPFSMTLYFQNGSKQTFRVHQQYIFGCCEGLQRIEGDNQLSCDVQGNCLQITVGKDCQPKNMFRGVKHENKVEVGMDLGLVKGSYTSGTETA